MKGSIGLYKSLILPPHFCPKISVEVASIDFICHPDSAEDSLELFVSVVYLDWHINIKNWFGL